MKFRLSRILLFFLVIGFTTQNCAQGKKSLRSSKKNPQEFSISGKDIQDVLKAELNTKIKSKTNTYINGAEVVNRTNNGDMQFARLKLDYFKNAYLTIQVNGTTSTQVFILSDDKQLAYKAKVEGDNYHMVKCEQDEIYSE